MPRVDPNAAAVYETRGSLIFPYKLQYVQERIYLGAGMLHHDARLIAYLGRGTSSGTPPANLLGRFSFWPFNLSLLELLASRILVSFSFVSFGFDNTTGLVIGTRSVKDPREP